MEDQTSHFLQRVLDEVELAVGRSAVEVFKVTDLD